MGCHLGLALLTVGLRVRGHHLVLLWLHRPLLRGVRRAHALWRPRRLAHLLLRANVALGRHRLLPHVAAVVMLLLLLGRHGLLAHALRRHWAHHTSVGHAVEWVLAAGGHRPMVGAASGRVRPAYRSEWVVRRWRVV